MERDRHCQRLVLGVWAVATGYRAALAVFTLLQLRGVCEFILVFRDSEPKSTLQGQPGPVLRACPAAPKGLLSDVLLKVCAWQDTQHQPLRPCMDEPATQQNSALGPELSLIRPGSLYIMIRLEA